MEDYQIQIPGTDYIALKNDGWLSASCVKNGRLVGDDEGIFQQPEFINTAKKKDKGVVLDIGAFIGTTARGFLDAGFSVHAFEPQPDAFSCLKHNCAGAFLYNQPVGNGEVVSLHGGKGGNMGARTATPAQECIKTLRVDDLHPQNVEIIKIDVEGMEPFVLDGAKETIAKFLPILFIEVNHVGLSRLSFNPHHVLTRIPIGYTFRIHYWCDTHFDVVCTYRP